MLLRRLTGARQQLAADDRSEIALGLGRGERAVRKRATVLRERDCNALDVPCKGQNMQKRERQTDKIKLVAWCGHPVWEGRDDTDKIKLDILLSEHKEKLRKILSSY